MTKVTIYILYAEGLKALKALSSILDSAILQNDVDTLYAWCQTNKLYLNSDKYYSVAYLHNILGSHT